MGPSAALTPAEGNNRDSEATHVFRVGPEAPVAGPVVKRAPHGG